MTNDEWVKINEPNFTERQIERFKEETATYYAYDLAYLGKERTDINRCRKLAAAWVKNERRGL